MKHYRVELTTLAADDIRRAYEWFVTENPAYAATWRLDITRKIQELKTLPKSHAVAPESEGVGHKIRQALFGRGIPWRILFRIRGETVQILHVRHGRRDYWHF